MYSIVYSFKEIVNNDKVIFFMALLAGTPTTCKFTLVGVFAFQRNRKRVPCHFFLWRCWQGPERSAFTN